MSRMTARETAARLGVKLDTVTHADALARGLNIVDAAAFAALVEIAKANVSTESTPESTPAA